MNTLLVVDIGNTTTKVGLWNGATVELLHLTPTSETGSLLDSASLDSLGPRSLGEGGSTFDSRSPRRPLLGGAGGGGDVVGLVPEPGR